MGRHTESPLGSLQCMGYKHALVSIMDTRKMCFNLVANTREIGFFMGKPCVSFLDTVPIQPWVRYLRVTGTVFHETCGVGGTCGFLVLFNITIY